ncbi:hypothetical protein Tco_0664559, partial [Tanacetum coccineum]
GVMMMMMAVVVRRWWWPRRVVGRQSEGVEARGGEWIWGSGRSADEDHIWCSPKKSAGKIRRKSLSGGGDRGRPVAAGYNGREGRERYNGGWLPEARMGEEGA